VPICTSSTSIPSSFIGCGRPELNRRLG
jgi:hypothetical protein